jgi:hypothetical protein
MIAAAGDIGPPSISAARAATAQEVLTDNPRAVLALGDLQYENGALADFLSYYKLNWGQFKSRTWPVPGNHEYHITNAQGYRDYFPGKPFPPYSFDVGAWHVLALNSEVEGSQVGWIASDLAAHPSQCALAYFHRPRYSSGTTHGSDTGVAKDLYGALLAGGVDVVLTGHEHNYERFAKQDNTSHSSPSGIREFVVGTGGELGSYPFGTPLQNSEVRVGPGVAGVLEMRLRAPSYRWYFTDTNGTSRDSGSDTCTNP